MSPHWRPQRGEVVLVNFPFVDTDGQAQAKPRPAVVISGKAVHQTTADVLIAAISSRPTSQPLPTDYEIREFQNLNYPSRTGSHARSAAAWEPPLLNFGITIFLEKPNRRHSRAQKSWLEENLLGQSFEPG